MFLSNIVVVWSYLKNAWVHDVIVIVGPLVAAWPHVPKMNRDNFLQWKSAF